MLDYVLTSGHGSVPKNHNYRNRWWIGFGPQVNATMQKHLHLFYDPIDFLVIHPNYFEKIGKLSEFISSIRRPEGADLRATNSICTGQVLH